jgi:hypothetical protein
MREFQFVLTRGATIDQCITEATEAIVGNYGDKDYSIGSCFALPEMTGPTLGAPKGSVRIVFCVVLVSSKEIDPEEIKNSMDALQKMKSAFKGHLGGQA